MPETSSAELFERINRNMDAILRTKESLMALENGPKKTPGEIKAELDQIRKDFLLTTLDKTQTETMHRRNELLIKKQAASTRLRNGMEFDVQEALLNEDEEKLSELRKEKIKLQDELAKINAELTKAENSNDRRIVATIDGLTKRLQRKAQWVDSRGHDREAILDLIRKHGYSIEDEQVLDIETGNMSVNLIMRPDFFDENIYGLHLTETPINLIAVDRRRNAMRHEQMHNFFFEPSTGRTNITFMTKGLERTAEELDKESSDTAQKQELLLAELERIDVGQALDSLKDELLAELENVETNWEGHPVNWNKRFSPNNDNTPNNLEDEFKKLAGAHSTAGFQAKEFVQALQAISERTDLDPNLVRRAQSNAQRFMRQFVRALNGLKTGLLTATFTEGADADDYTHAFAYLMEPSQYRHLPAALRHRFGAERYDPVKAGLDAIMNLGLKPINLDLLLQIEEDENYPGRDYLRLHLSDGLAAALKHGAALEMFRSIRPADSEEEKLESFLEKTDRLLASLELDETQIDRLLNDLRQSPEHDDCLAA
ncbi:MAG: hypothetical protein ABIJ46_03290 [bacterium]